MFSLKKSQKIVKIFFVAILLIYIFLISIFIVTSSRSYNLQDKTGDISAEINTLAEKDYTFQELTDFFTEVAKRKGGVYAYRVLSAASLKPNTDMHLLAHAIGDVLYEQEGVNGITYCTQDFRNACSHSIVIALFRKYGLAAIPKISGVCKQAPGGRLAYPMCFHGLGHGVLAYTKYDMTKAVNLCKYTGTKERSNVEFIECSGGMVMEMMNGVHEPEQWEKEKRRYFSEDDPLSPCNTDTMPEETKPICYVYLTPHLFEYVGTDMQYTPTNDNLENAFALCNDIPQDQRSYRDACYGGFGKEFVVLAQNGDIRKVDQMGKQQLARVYNWCLLADSKEAEASCIQYAIGSLFWGGDNDRQASIHFCETVVDPNHQSTCISSLIDTVAKNVEAESYRKSFCSELPSGYQTECKHILHV